MYVFTVSHLLGTFLMFLGVPSVFYSFITLVSTWAAQVYSGRRLRSLRGGRSRLSCVASHNFKNFEFCLRGAHFLVTFWKQNLKIELLLVFYCLDGFQAWSLVLGGRGGRFYQSLRGASSELAFKLRGGSFSFFLTKIFLGKKRVFFLGDSRRPPNFFWWKRGVRL